MKNPKINIALKPEIFDMLALFAKHNKSSVSSMGGGLLENAIKECEEFLMYREAKNRERAFSPKKALSHRQVFK
ncbi:MAG: hypothetical protein NTW04_00185 [Elusimicrobia bacterium]|nr:hypothetical protein [Elusimicrobiota bacterium]